MRDVGIVVIFNEGIRPIKALEALVEVGSVEAKAVVSEVALNDHRDVVREEAADCLQDFE